MSDEDFNRTTQVGRLPGLPAFFALAVMLLLLFGGATLWLTHWQGGDADPEEARRAELRTKTLAELCTDNDKKLETYAWIDRAKGSVQIPIAEAMKLTLADINATRPHAAYPVASPAPTAAPAPSAAPAPAKP